MQQKTIRKSISCSGIGLHSGEKVHLALHPAQEDTGLVFMSINASRSAIIDLHPDKVRDTGLATTIAEGDSSISTIEHFLSAAYGLGLDNLRVEVFGNELPILDGSASPYVFLLKSAGIRTQSKPKNIMRFKRDMKFEKDGKSIRVRPYNGFRVHYTIDFDHPMIGEQEFTFQFSPEAFNRDVANARTFGFLKDVEKMQQMGLARGGSLDNAVVLDEYDVVNPEGLRFKDEMVRHKILDFIGDMAVMGMPMWGDFRIKYSGHALNNAFLRFLVRNQDDYLEPVPEEKAAAALNPDEVQVPEMEPALA
ncbi:MAG: UDP-3-O-acyl-N-acetylglucosamine deacetylase [Desulfonatronovibrionaceae bacterium]